MRRLFLEISIVGLVCLLSFLPKTVYPHQQLAKTLATEYRYISDAPLTNYWQTPAETVLKKGGDCEDLAIFTYTALIEAGCKVKMFVVKDGVAKDLHIVTAFKIFKNYYGVFSNTDIIYVSASSLVEAVLLCYNKAYKRKVIRLYQFTPRKYGETNPVNNYVSFFKNKIEINGIQYR